MIGTYGKNARKEKPVADIEYLDDDY